MFKVLICGGRFFDDEPFVHEALTKLHKQRPFDWVIHGGANGVDTFAGNWAKANKVQYIVYRAKWKTYGNAAGPIRNKEMLDKEKPHVVIAFPGGAGTKNMIKLAQEYGVPVHQPFYDKHANHQDRDHAKIKAALKSSGIGGAT